MSDLHEIQKNKLRPYVGYSLPNDFNDIVAMDRWYSCIEC